MPTPPNDPSVVDDVLTTTRTVRKRLDLERPVDTETILDCIDIAEQAPTGGNQASRRWLVIDDPRQKQKLAELYRESAGRFMLQARDALAGSGHPHEKNMDSAAYLVEHLGEVPAIVIPTIIGRHDGSGRPGLFDSVIQSGWSFCLAARARGLGTAWVTAVFTDESAVKELLGFPDDTTEIVMLPVAHTVGTDFSRAPRRPAREITSFNTFGHTFETGPSLPAAFEDGAGGFVEIDIKADADTVWNLISDINVGAQYSEEFQGAEWLDEPGPGARFIGRNDHAALGAFEVECFIHAYEEGSTFGWSTSDIDNPGARWRFDIESIAGSVRLRYSHIIGPGPSGITGAIASMPDKEDRVLRARVREHRQNMRRVVEGIKEAAESMTT